MTESKQELTGGLFKVSPADILKKYQKEKTPLVGIYNIETKEITLFPTFSERVTLLTDSTLSGNCADLIYTSILEDGFRAHKNGLENYNSKKESGFIFPARYIDNSKRWEPLTPHEYLCKIIGVPESDLPKYRGFSYIPDSNGQYQLEFKSGALNSPRDPTTGKRIRRERGAEPADVIKHNIEQQVTLLELHNLQRQDFLEDLKTAITTAKDDYHSHYLNGRNKDRGYKNGFFSFLRHGETGQNNAQNFNNTIQSLESPTDVLEKMRALFEMKSTRYHTHSFATYLIDELVPLLKAQEIDTTSLKPDEQGRYSQAQVKSILTMLQSINPQAPSEQALRP